MTKDNPGSCDPEIAQMLTKLESVTANLAQASATMLQASADIATLTGRLEQMQLAMSRGHPAQVADAMLKRQAW